MIIKLIYLFSTLLYIPVLYPVVGGRNAVQAERLYRRRLPEKPSPSHRMFSRLTSRLRETGSLNPRPQHRPRTCTDERAEVAVLATIAVNPQISTRQIEREVDVLFTDKASFSNKGILNMRNMHYWSADNPKWLRQVEHQRPWKVNVWCGIIGATIIGPFFINGIQNGRQYSRFIRHNLPVLLDAVPLNQRMVMCYQRDGCPAHNALRARRLLTVSSLIGGLDEVAWLGGLPDLRTLHR
ncbi:uncharacterized protein LOC126457306 [Schistocerca serialis cubense]|uniref:uncharacterized protein LOC126457306 n=1 Tax=Schistocerca serialis cubense TaxID=2023355 RepID=UPI00214EF078|nr:uncharacterized protein LOC126457306 [Schistocerca serialis cubense]